MRFFYHYPETSGADEDMLDPGPLHEVVAAAERSGFDGFSLTEHPLPGARWLAACGHQSLDPQGPASRGAIRSPSSKWAAWRVMWHSIRMRSA